MKKVLIAGTFDIIHPGHIYFIKQAKKHGDFLIIVVARDKTVKQAKKHFPKNSESIRLKKLKSLNLADRVILGNIGDKYKIIEKAKPDIICLGYDQKIFTKNLKTRLKKRNLYPKIIRIKPYHPDKYKTSLLAGKKLDKK